jgi:hypothetical protein
MFMTAHLSIFIMSCLRFGGAAAAFFIPFYHIPAPMTIPMLKIGAAVFSLFAGK